MKPGNILLLLLLLLLPGELLAQQLEWSQGEKMRRKMVMTEILGQNDWGIYARRYDHTTRQRKFTLDYYAPDMRLLESRQVKLGRGENLQQVLLFPNGLLLFYTEWNRNKRQLELRAHRLDAELNYRKKAIKVAELEDATSRTTRFSVEFATDSSRILALRNPFGWKEEGSITSYSIDTATLEASAFELPETKYQLLLVDWMALKDKSYFLIHSRKNAQDVGQMRLYRLQDSTLNPILNLYNEEVASTQGRLAMDWLNDRLVVVGLTQTAVQEPVPGYVYAALPVGDDSAEVRFQPFPPLLMEQLQGRKRDWQGLFNMRLRDVVVKSNGGVIVSLEQVRHEREMTPSATLYPSPLTNVRNYYYLQDVLTMNLDAEGELLSQQVLKKDQVTLNDNAYWSSFKTMILPSQLIYIYNDLTRKDWNLMGYRIQPGAHAVSRILVNGKEFNGRLALREAEQVDANTLVIPAFTQNREYRLLRISF